MYFPSQSEPVSGALNQIKIIEGGHNKIMEQPKRKVETERRELSKEIIRRLRIQNKQLLQQVASFKARIKIQHLEKKQLLSKLNDQVKLNACLTEALGGGRKRGRGSR